MSESKGSKESQVAVKQKLLQVALVGVLLIPILMFFMSGTLGEKKVLGNQGDYHEQQVMALFEPMESVEVHSVSIGYGAEVIASASLLSGNKEQTVTNGVVIVYSGVLQNVYELTKAISILLDVPIHQISFIEV